ncbi:hypothetical protein [Cohnella candidum]|uniref:Spore germination protein GerPC n=1 Tax=Cohnella candidum TaxID=2674991 RepID=A0A3G3JXL7_9BACL|nr:hypothetical protein [Cohnella candidum]AYQ72986.1 hypothetical protein EAV92_10675 [Cohnella candidum]
MRNPFRRKTPDQRDAFVQELKTQIREMNVRFHRLEENLERLNGKFPQVTIENVHIHQPVLEKLEFRLDALDIEQLSGSLNLGNNFGARTAPERGSVKSTAEKGKPGEAGGENVSPQEFPGLERTPSGFRLNNRR